MRRLEAATEALGWAYRYRQVQQDTREQEAAKMATAAKSAEAALTAARDDRAAAADQWLRVAVEGQNLDPMLGRLWQAEFDRCTAAEGEAEQARDKAAEALKVAIAAFQSAAVIADHSHHSFEVAKTRLARKADERRLSVISDLLAHRRPVR